MPVKKMMYRKKTRASKKSYKKTAVKKTVTRMLTARGLNKPELKNWINVASAAVIATTPASVGLQLDPQRQGNNDIIYNGNVYPTSQQDGNVIGDKILAKYINFSAQFYNDDTHSHFIRILIVCDNQPQGSDALVPYSAAKVGSNANMWLNSLTTSLYIPQSTRFNVLFDKTVALSGDNDEKSLAFVRKRINLNNARVQYTQSAADSNVLIPNNRKYLLYLIPDNNEQIFGVYQVDFGFSDV